MSEVKKNKKSMKSLWEGFKIRMVLLWLWFLKNLTVILKTAGVVIVILILTNAIDAQEIATVLGVEGIDPSEWKDFKNASSAIVSILSAVISILYLFKKTKSLAIDDIKSRKVKIALIKARLYFNENGKLCRRAESITQMDLNGDGKVVDTPVEEVIDENIITGIPRAIGELTTILTAKIDTEEEVTENAVVEESELNEEVEPEVNENIEVLYTEDEHSEEIAKETTDEPKKVKKAKKMNPIKRFFKEFKRALAVSLSNPELNDNMEDKKSDTEAIAEIKETRKRKKQTKYEIVEDTEETTSETILNTNISTEVNNIVNNTASQEHKENTTEVIQQAPESRKARQIEDILKNFK